MIFNANYGMQLEMTLTTIITILSVGRVYMLVQSILVKFLCDINKSVNYKNLSHKENKTKLTR